MSSPRPPPLARLVAALVALVLLTGCAIVPAQVAARGSPEIAATSRRRSPRQRRRRPRQPVTRSRRISCGPGRARVASRWTSIDRNDHVRAVHRQLVRGRLDADDDQPHGARQARPVAAHPEGPVRPGARDEPVGGDADPAPRSTAGRSAWARRATARSWRCRPSPAPGRSGSPRARCASRASRSGCSSGVARMPGSCPGFKATADPAYTDDFDVTAVWIEDPWHGRVSRTWGGASRRTPWCSANRLSRRLRQVVEPSPAGVRPRRRATSSWRRSSRASVGGHRRLVAGGSARPPPDSRQRSRRATLSACASRPGTSTPSRRAWTPSSAGWSGPRRTCC